jgi:LPXTG-motif cell wall-anchored protein
MKKLMLMFVMAAMVVMMTGCMQADYHLTINKDMSGNLAYKVGVSSDVMALAKNSESGDPLAKLSKEYKDAGYTVKKYKADGYEGFIVSKSFQDVRKADISLKTASTKDMEGDTKMSYHQQKGFFSTKASATIEVDMTTEKLAKELAQSTGEVGDMAKGAGEKEMKAALALVGDALDMTFTITMPGKASKHNATKVSDGGRTLSWKLKFGKINKLHVEANAPNTTNISLVIGGVLIVLVGAYLTLRRRKATTFVYDAVESPAADAPASDAEAPVGDAPGTDAESK